MRDRERERERERERIAKEEDESLLQFHNPHLQRICCQGEMMDSLTLTSSSSIVPLPPATPPLAAAVERAGGAQDEAPHEVGDLIAHLKASPFSSLQELSETGTVERVRVCVCVRECVRESMEEYQREGKEDFFPPSICKRATKKNHLRAHVYART